MRESVRGCERVCVCEQAAHCGTHSVWEPVSEPSEPANENNRAREWNKYQDANESTVRASGLVNCPSPHATKSLHFYPEFFASFCSNLLVNILTSDLETNQFNRQVALIVKC